MENRFHSKKTFPIIKPRLTLITTDHVSSINQLKKIYLQREEQSWNRLSYSKRSRCTRCIKSSFQVVSEFNRPDVAHYHRLAYRKHDSDEPPSRRSLTTGKRVNVSSVGSIARLKCKSNSDLYSCNGCSCRSCPLIFATNLIWNLE